MKKLEKIFIVEDEDDIRTIAQIAIEDIGNYQLGSAASGMEALSIMPDFKPDLILLDVMMPGMDGIQTFQELKKIPVLRNTPVVFMTAKVQDSEKNSYKDLGAVDVIPKPFDPLTLSSILEGLWKQYYGQ